ncbi:MAG TPA: efflux RND transporter periplasmic adaptor subunit [Steroidobacteraceae bacterium]|nr:efflux RND transporter periplasmic adaptor subunit [Steroidobacteraceae bacterium]
MTLQRFLAMTGLALAIGSTVAACKEKEQPAVPRAVRVMWVAGGAAGQNSTYTADIRSRYESDLGFQVGGKIAQRMVDVGAQVKKGTALARLDEQDLRLAVESSQSAVNAAKAELDRAKSDEARFRDLLERGLTTAATFLAQQTQTKTAQSRYEQMSADLQLRRQQLGYATLRADRDGVITRTYADAGSVVAQGQRVVALAQPSAPEAVFDVAEQRVDEVRGEPSIEIVVLSLSNTKLGGSIREVSPSADPVTRTYQVRVSIENPPPNLRLGMTATVTLRRTGPAPMISVPATALFQKDEKPAVWIVKADKKLELRPITVDHFDTLSVAVASGLAPGEMVVTAGVHKLAAGETVRILGDVAP